MGTRGIDVRTRFQGVTNVVRFNWPMYVGAATLSAAALFFDSVPLRFLGASSLFYLCVSLLVSHYVYDISDLYQWTWLKKRLNSPLRIFNIHSGFDETTTQLEDLYPGCPILALDFYDHERNPEPSIARARKLYPVGEDTIRVDSRHLPFDRGAAPVVCCLLAAHEIRTHSERVKFFKEIARVLGVNGQFFLVEHLRDVPNFMAFGPGFVHFFSRRDWLKAIDESGLQIVEEFPVNVFVRGFELRVAPS